MPIFEYGDKEVDYLKRKDKKLAAAIERIGKIERGITPESISSTGLEAIQSRGMSMRKEG